MYNRFDNQFDNRFDNRLCRVNGALEWQRLSNNDCLEVKKEDCINHNSVLCRLSPAVVHSDTHTHEQYLKMTA